MAKKLIFLVICAGLMASGGAFAATTFDAWVGSTGNWEVPGDWSLNAVPASGVTAVISNGGSVTVTQNDTADALITGTAATDSAQNFLTINSGVTLTTSVANSDLGFTSGQSGEATVSGTWALGSKTLAVGFGGTGILNLQSGGSLTANSVTLGSSAGANGSASISGNLTTTTSVVVGSSGSGSLTLSSSGSISSVGFTLGSAASGSGTADISGLLNYSGANLTVGSNGTGALTIENGGIVTGTLANPVNIGSAAGSAGTVDVKSGANFLVTDNLVTVGSSGAGSLTVEAGGQFTSLGGNIGAKQGGIGSVIVGGTWSGSGGSLGLAIGYASSGNAGTGSLTVEGGGLVISSVAELGGSGSVGGMGSGTATVENNGLWQLTTALDVGESGTGSLIIENGGTVQSKSGVIGQIAGGMGIVSVSGTWQIGSVSGNTLQVGSAGTGVMTIGSGGSVSDFQGFLGDIAGSTGTATVQSGGLWQNASAIDVGLNGTGVLVVANGGTVSSVGTSFVGFAANSSGTATIRGTWSNSGNITVGSSGTGVLSIGAGGLVNVNAGSGTLTIGGAATSAGVLNIGANAGGTAEAPGTLNAASVVGSNSPTITPLLNFNHTGTNYVFQNSGGQGILIQGNVEVTNIAGTTVLIAASTYTAGTMVQGGTLVVNNATGSGLGSGSVSVSGGKLMGNGAIAGAVTLQNGGSLGAGYTSTGTLTLNSQLTWETGGIISLRLGSTAENSDLIVAGSLTNGGPGAYDFSFSDGIGGPVAGETYTLINYGTLGSGWDVSDFSYSYNGSQAGFGGTFSIDTVNNDIDFTVAAVPEPPIASLAIVSGLGLMGLALLRSRRMAR